MGLAEVEEVWEDLGCLLDWNEIASKELMCGNALEEERSSQASVDPCEVASETPVNVVIRWKTWLDDKVDNYPMLSSTCVLTEHLCVILYAWDQYGTGLILWAASVGLVQGVNQL